MTENNRNSRQLEVSYKNIINTSIDGFWITDTEGRFLDVNRAYCHLIGYSREELLKMRISDVEVLEKPEETKKHIKTVIRVGYDRFETKHKCKNGKIVNIEASASFLNSDRGRFAVFLRDITERNKNREKLFQSEQRYRQIIETTQEGYGEIDLNLQITSANKCCAEMFGYTLDEFIGLNIIEDLLLPIDKGGFLVQMKQRQRDKVGIYEQRFCRKNGETMWVIVSGTPIKDESGVVRGSFAMMTNINERKKAEAILVESERRYKTLIDVAPLCIKWFDDKGNLISVNQHGKEEHFLTGKSDEEIKNWHYMDCIEEKYRDMVKAKMADALAGKQSEFDMEHVSGTSTGHWCHSYLVPAPDEKGQIKYILFISRDFTAEKVAQDEKNKNLEILEKFKDLTVGRELKMIELKKQIGELKSERSIKND